MLKKLTVRKFRSLADVTVELPQLAGRSARPEAPGCEEAHDALLAAINVLRAVRDEFPS